MLNWKLFANFVVYNNAKVRNCYGIHRIVGEADNRTPQGG